MPLSFLNPNDRFPSDRLTNTIQLALRDHKLDREGACSCGKWALNLQTIRNTPSQLREAMMDRLTTQHIAAVVAEKLKRDGVDYHENEEGLHG